jgi:hypothetical protein
MLLYHFLFIFSVLSILQIDKWSTTKLHSFEIIIIII